MWKSPKFQLLLGIALSVVFIAIALRPVKLEDLWQAFRTMNWLYAVPFVIVTFVGFWFRAVRWRWLLMGNKEFTSYRLWKPMMAGFALNSIFPARAGEFARAYIIMRKDGVSYPVGLGSIVVERLFDMLVLLLLLPVALWSIDIDPTRIVEYSGFKISGASLNKLSTQLAIMSGIIMLACLILVVPATRNLCLKILHLMTFLPKKFREIIESIIHKFAEGMAALTSAKAIVVVTLLSLAVWIPVGWSMQIMAMAFPGMEMNFMAGIAITVITCLAIIIPAAPGYWGLFELGVVFGLVALGIEKDQSKALAYAFVVHALQIFPIIAVGLYYLYQEKITVGEIQTSQSSQTSEGCS